MLELASTSVKVLQNHGGFKKTSFSDCSCNFQESAVRMPGTACPAWCQVLVYPREWNPWQCQHGAKAKFHHGSNQINGVGKAMCLPKLCDAFGGIVALAHVRLHQGLLAISSDDVFHNVFHMCSHHSRLSLGISSAACRVLLDTDRTWPWDAISCAEAPDA